MGFLNNLLHGPAVLAMKNAEPETPTIMDSMPEAISWPTDAEFAGYANGMYCREYAVRVVVDFISRQLASLPLKVYRKNADGDAEEVRDGALAKLIRHPSDLPGMSRYRFYATLIRDMLLEDRWLCTLGSNRAGDGNTLRRIPPDGYSLTANGFGELTGVTISSVAENKGGTYRLPDPRIVLDIGYIDGLNLGDPITDVLRPLLAEARVMAKYRKSIAENGYQIPAYVYRPKEMPWESQADYDDFTQGLRNYVAGGGMAGTWPVFKDGMEIRTVDNLFKPVDMADLEARVVVHWYADAKGNVSQTQSLRGVDEITQVYDYSNAETAELNQKTCEKLQDLQSEGEVKVAVHEDSGIVFDVGDTVTARDNLTGITVNATISKKIVKVSGGVMSVDYEAE